MKRVIMENIEIKLNTFKESIYNLEQMEKDYSNICDSLKKKKLVIYPAGVSGRMLQKTLYEHFLDVVLFFDREYKSLGFIDNIEVLDVEKLKDLDEKYVVLISANLQTQYNFFVKIVKNLNKNLKIINGIDLNRFLKSKKCIAKLKNNDDFDLIECENCGFERTPCNIITSYLKKVGKHKEFENDTRSVKFDWFGCIVSQKCSLKCKHCCEHIPSQKDKGFVSVQSIVDDVKKIAKSSKFLNFVELIGGEPFLHPKIDELITELLKIENIGYIKSFTNGTIVPSNKLCQIMQDKRFMLSVSNYEKVVSGKKLENIYKTREKLKSYNIKYLFTENFEWLDFNSFEKHEAPDSYFKQFFKKCFIHICHRLYKGKLYRCPHQYAGVQLGKLKENPIECIDVRSMNEKELSKALEDFENIDFLEACRHCTLPFNPKPVPAGIQIGIKNAK